MSLSTTGAARVARVVRLRVRRLPGGVSGWVGLLLLVLVGVIAFLGPHLAPYSPSRVGGGVYDWPNPQALLGTDRLGRDVLSRVLGGGRSVLQWATLATALAYGAGLLVGLTAGYARSWIAGALMRAMDVLLSFPALLFVLVLAAGFGRSIVPVVFATAIVQLPAIARIVRTATVEQVTQGYVEAAIVRGETAFAVLRREILPNIGRTLAADVGLRFTWSVLLIASVNFLGLGLQPPAADWGLMISENRAGIGLNPSAMLVPALMLGMLTVGITLLTDWLSGSPADRRRRS